MLDNDATAYIQALLTSPVKPVPFSYTVQDEDEKKNEQLEVFEMPLGLQGDEFATSITLVVPPGTRDAWQAVRRHMARDAGRPHKRYLVIGSPGVGKSRSINYFIRHIISERRKTCSSSSSSSSSSACSSRPLPVIVFEHRKDQKVWLFAPTAPEQADSVYSAYSIILDHFHANATAVLHNPDNVYLIDSGLAEEAKMPANVPAVTVYVCSPDERHFSEYEKHTQAGGTFFIPWWQPEALLAAQPFMLAQSCVTAGDVEQRIVIVGPIPRRVYCTDKQFEKIKSKIETAMQNKQAEIGNVLVHGAAGLDADQEKDKPLSAVFAIDVEPHSHFQVRLVRFVSDFARMRLGLATLKHVYDSIVSNMDSRRNAELGATFESVVYRFLHHGWKTKMRILPAKTKMAELVVQPGVGPVQLVQAGAGLWQRGYDAMQQMQLVESASSPPLFLGANFPLIDAADARNRGFSVTIAKTKTIKQATVDKLRDKLGLQAAELLHIVFVVPEHYAVPDVGRAPYQLHGVQWYHATLPSPLAHESDWKQALDY